MAHCNSLQNHNRKMEKLTDENNHQESEDCDKVNVACQTDSNAKDKEVSTSHQVIQSKGLECLDEKAIMGVINSMMENFGLKPESFPGLKKSIRPLVSEYTNFVKDSIENQDNPNEVIKNYCRWFSKLDSHPYGKVLIDCNLQLGMCKLIRSVLCQNPLIFMDNFGLIKNTFDRILPKLRNSSQKIMILRNIIMEGLIQQRNFHQARKIIHQIVMMNCTHKDFSDYFHFKFDLTLNLARCLIEESRHSKALLVLTEKYHEIYSLKSEDWEKLGHSLLKDLGNYFLELDEPKRAIEIIELSLSFGKRKFGEKYLSCEDRFSCLIAMVLSGRKLKNEAIIEQNLKAMKIGFKDINFMMRRMMFQKNVPTFLNIFQECLICKCQREKSNWRLFKNNWLIGYLSRKVFEYTQ